MAASYTHQWTRAAEIYSSFILFGFTVANFTANVDHGNSCPSRSCCYIFIQWTWPIALWVQVYRPWIEELWWLKDNCMLMATRQCKMCTWMDKRQKCVHVLWSSWDRLTVSIVLEIKSNKPYSYSTHITELSQDTLHAELISTRLS